MIPKSGNRFSEKIMLIQRSSVPIRSSHTQCCECSCELRIGTLVSCQVEKMSSCGILHLDDPGVRIEADLAHQTLLDLRFWRGLLAQRATKGTIGRVSFTERRLRRRAEQLRGTVKPVQLDENCAGLLRATAPHGSECAFDMAAANISGHPDR